MASARIVAKSCLVTFNASTVSDCRIVSIGRGFMQSAAATNGEIAGPVADIGTVGFVSGGTNAAGMDTSLF